MLASRLVQRVLHRAAGGKALVLGLVLSASAAALGKQRAGAHGGKVEGPSEGMNFSGDFRYGVSLYNPTYAARPDNTGLALFRYALHLDLDLIGRRLSIPVHLNMFTDGTRRGAGIFVPSEGDVSTGLTSTWGLGPGAVELGGRVEHDAPLDRGGVTQTYLDTRVRYLYSLSRVSPLLERALADGDVHGWLGLGVLPLNSSYFARPDNTGRALFRYMVHTEVSAWHDLFAIGLDARMFSDRRAPNVVAPSELDLTPELIFRRSPFELHLAYERDMPLDRGGLVQHFVYLLGVWSFDFSGEEPEEAERRNPGVSP